MFAEKAVVFLCLLVFSQFFSAFAHKRSDNHFVFLCLLVFSQFFSVSAHKRLDNPSVQNPLLRPILQISCQDPKLISDTLKINLWSASALKFLPSEGVVAQWLPISPQTAKCCKQIYFAKLEKPFCDIQRPCGGEFWDGLTAFLFAHLAETRLQFQSEPATSAPEPVSASQARCCRPEPSQLHISASDHAQKSNHPSNVKNTTLQRQSFVFICHSSCARATEGVSWFVLSFGNNSRVDSPS